MVKVVVFLVVIDGRMEARKIYLHPARSGMASF